MEQLEKAIAAIKEKMPELELRESEPMSEHCSFKLGGPVRAFAVPKDIWEFSKHSVDNFPILFAVFYVSLIVEFA